MFLVEDEQETKPMLKADIRIIGIGGGGNNSIETMIRNKVKNVKFIAVNTDAQALAHCSCETKIQLGEKLTKGLGAGANPHIGHRAALESYDEIIRQIKGADMLFITAGMGGGTGTGGAPVIAEAAKELGILTVAFVTRPFLCEGSKRRRQADMGIQKLKKHVDTLITLPNEKLLDISSSDDSLIETFKKTDEILLQAVKGIADLVNVQGLINLDFADVKTVMSNKGMALMSIGAAQGPNRAVEAVARALDSPLLSDVSIQGATGMIVNITSDSRLSLKEVNRSISCLTKEIDPDADIIVGTVIDENMEDKLSITLIATGFSDNLQKGGSIANLSQSLKNQQQPQFTNEQPQQTSQPQQELNPEQQESVSQQEEPASQEELTSQEEPTPEDQQEETTSPEAAPISQKAASQQEPNPEPESEQPEPTPQETQPLVQTQTEENKEEEIDQDFLSYKSADSQPLKNSTIEKSEPEEETQTAKINTEIKEPTETNNEEIPVSTHNVSLRDKLLLKAKEYSKEKETPDSKEENSVIEQNQMSIDWDETHPEDSSFENISTSPFEESIDFSEDDLA